MKTTILPADNEKSLYRASEILKRGGLVAFPTDTVYGVGALASHGKAVESIYAAKDRPLEKSIPLLVNGLGDFEKVAKDIPPMAMKLAAHYWPGPLTLVVPKDPSLPGEISSKPTVGVRVPDHPTTLALLKITGPLAVTSANISGQPSPKRAAQVFHQLNGRIPLILDGGKAPGGMPSTVVDCTGREPVILRDGPISAEDIHSVLA